MKKIIIVMIGTIFLCSCANWDTQTTRKKNQGAVTIKPTEKYCNFAAFRAIVINGDALVELVQNDRKYAARFVGTNADQYDCANSVIDQTLYVNSGRKKGKLSHISATIYVPQLNNITIAGNAALNAKKFSSDKLQISVRDYGSINLHGKFNITKIDKSGHGRINIDWVDSANLIINSQGSGPIYLGGRVDSLLAKLAQDAKLYARYLRAATAKVFTTDRASAEILPIENLDAFAVNHSNIYYYKHPKKITIVTKDSANVLYLDWVR